MPDRLRAAWLTVLLLAVSSVGRAQPVASDAPRLTLEDIFASATFAGASFESGRWAARGPVVTFTEVDDGGATDLISYNLETDVRTTLIEGERLRAPDVDRRIAIEGYQFSPDGRRVLLVTDTAPVWRYNTQGFYYVYDVEAQTLTPLSDRRLGYQQFAKFHPSGQAVAFVRGRNLFRVDLETMQETQLTFDGAEGTIINGTSDWVYEEEFGLRDGWSWSPDGQHLAFFQFDESATRDFVMADLRGHYPELIRFRYPKAGEANSEIRIGRLGATPEDTLFFDTDTWRTGGETHEYLPAMGWTPAIDGRHYVWMLRMNRDQNVLDLLFADPATGAVRTILQETSDTWLEVETGFSDQITGQLTFLEDGEHFIWFSERDGHRHLYLYRNDGTFVRQLTRGPWDVTVFHGVDEARGVLYVTGTRESPMERHLYRVPFRPEPGTDVPEPVRITRRAGWHDVNMSADLNYYIDAYSNVTTPPVVSLHRATGEPLRPLEENERLIETVLAYDLPAPEFITVPAADGTPLNAMLIKPASFDPSKSYPLLIYTYGGPGSQTVMNRWGSGRGSRYLWHQYLAQELGVVVASVDNRGTGARGRDFRSVTYRRLGQIEAADQIAAARHLAALPYVDARRVGIWGWSYGGYLTLMALLTGDGPETFRVGLAVAPVTDWRQYDTIYTERYMSTPQKNPRGYAAGAPQAYAARLRDDQRLLIVHGDLDDNVHFQNTIQMIDRLQAANRPFDLMVYPGRDHALRGGQTPLHLFTYLTRYLREHLVAASP